MLPGKSVDARCQIKGWGEQRFILIFSAVKELVIIHQNFQQGSPSLVTRLQLIFSINAHSLNNTTA